MQSFPGRPRGDSPGTRIATPRHERRPRDGLWQTSPRHRHATPNHPRKRRLPPLPPPQKQKTPGHAMCRPGFPTERTGFVNWIPASRVRNAAFARIAFLRKELGHYDWLLCVFMGSHQILPNWDSFWDSGNCLRQPIDLTIAGFLPKSRCLRKIKGSWVCQFFRWACGRHLASPFSSIAPGEVPMGTPLDLLADPRFIPESYSGKARAEAW